MTGTEWTAPGQGASVGEIHDAVCGPDRWGEKAKKLTEIPNPIGKDLVHSALAHLCTLIRMESQYDWGKSNLRLTGSPLTAEDLKRIADCEVSR